MEFALNNGCPVDIKDRFYKTALMHAAAAGQADTVKYLLKHNADPNMTDNMKWTPLHHAVSSGGLSVAKLLVEAGADIHAKTQNGATVLMRAAQVKIEAWASKIGQLKVDGPKNADVQFDSISLSRPSTFLSTVISVDDRINHLLK